MHRLLYLQWGKNPLPLLLNIIHTHQLASTGGPLVDEDAAVQAYHTMKRNPGESTNKYQARIEGTIKVMKRLGNDLFTPQQQAIQYLKFMDRAKHWVTR